MKFKIILFIIAAITLKYPASSAQTEKKETKELSISTEILKKQNFSEILVAAHRGDWRNAPENSLQALKNTIERGVDIMELDLKKSKDGHLVIMHDETINRSTNGTGKPSRLYIGGVKTIPVEEWTGKDNGQYNSNVKANAVGGER